MDVTLAPRVGTGHGDAPTAAAAPAAGLILTQPLGGVGAERDAQHPAAELVGAVSPGVLGQTGDARGWRDPPAAPATGDALAGGPREHIHAR